MTFEKFQPKKTLKLFSWLSEIYVKAEIISCGRCCNSYPAVYNEIHCRTSCLSSVCTTFCIKKKSRYQSRIAQRLLTALDKWHLHVSIRSMIARVALSLFRFPFTGIWFHLQKKAQSEHININRPIPLSLKKHHE